MMGRLMVLAATVGALSFPLHAHATLHAGDVAPDFRGTALNGVSHTLYQYRGKVVVLFILQHN